MENEWIIALVKLMLINLVLSGDNAVVIALACRNLPEGIRKKAVFWGTFGAIGLRVVLTFATVWLLKIPYVQIIGGVLLLWIAVKLLKGEGEGSHTESGSTIKAAIKTIIIADFAMSLDNVLAIAGAAFGNYYLIFLGLALSIPIIVFGSHLLMYLMDRFPIIIWIGAGLLGFTAGEMVLNDEAVGHTIEMIVPAAHYLIPFGLAALVIFAGKVLNRMTTAKQRNPEIQSSTTS